MPGISYEYRGPGHSHTHNYLYDPVNAFLASLPPDSKVLDMGCGNGSFLSLFRDKGWRRFGTDFSTDGIAVAKEHFSDATFFLADAQNAEAEVLAQAGLLDAVISTEVIEHLYAPRAFLKTVYNVLQPGGLFVLSTPYHGYLKDLALAVTGKMDQHHTVLWDHGHIKFWSRATLTSVCLEAGFEVVGFRGTGRVPYLWKSMVMALRKPDDRR